MIGTGNLRMDHEKVSVAYPEKPIVAKIKVRRVKGSEEEISCMFQSKPDTAAAGLDYLNVDGELTFPAGCIEKIIEVPIMKKVDATSHPSFIVQLFEKENNGSVLCIGQTIATVTIYCADDTDVTCADKLEHSLEASFTKRTGHPALNNDWVDQFKAAFQPECEDEESATAVDWTLHIVSFPWKVLFAFTPPASYCGGWLAFYIALVFIGATTVLIGDLATLVGCVAGVNSSITAITIVALGTSLPDTFASKTSAVEDPSADAAIGNVTGSNSVNVFLGLGLPWVIGTFYWQGSGKTEEWIYRYPEQHLTYADGGLVVLSGDLTFSVLCFTMCALCTLGVIWYRRVAFGAELGGPKGIKTNTSIFLVLLWIFYVTMASWKVIQGDVSTGQCVMVVM